MPIGEWMADKEAKAVGRIVLFDPITATLAGGLNIGSSVLQANAADKAADAQAASADRATKVQWDMYNQTRQDQQLGQNAGQNALAQMMEQMGYGVNQTTPTTTGNVKNDAMYSFSAQPNQNKLFQGFQASPSYAFDKAEQTRALENSQAARGGLLSGNALRATSELSSNLANREYGNYWNRLAGLAGVGQQANTTMAGVGQNTAGQVGNSLMQSGNARASGYAAKGQIYGNALNNLTNFAGSSLFGVG